MTRSQAGHTDRISIRTNLRYVLFHLASYSFFFLLINTERKKNEMRTKTERISVRVVIPFLVAAATVPYRSLLKTTSYNTLSLGEGI